MRKTFFLLAAAVMACACNVQKRIVYIQDVLPDDVMQVVADNTIRIRPLDRLTVVVTSSDPELAAPFNSSISYNSVTGGPSGNISGRSSLQVRTVNAEGVMDMPVIGPVECAGKTREQIAADIAGKIREGGYISDPTVNIEFADMKITVLGEVMRPGQYDIVRDKISVLEALAMAGDMTIYGMRDCVTVIREEDGETTAVRLDMRSKDIFSSPYFYLRQNDVVYVRPNKYKAATAEINQNRTFWLSLVGSLVSVSTLVISIISLSKRR